MIIVRVDYWDERGYFKQLVEFCYCQVIDIGDYLVL